MKSKLSMSIMCADPLNLEQAVREIEQADADFVHADIMDGNFVDNLTLGMDQLAAIADASSVPVEAHLMVAQPDKILPAVLKTKCTHVSFHVEATPCPVRYLGAIRAAGKQAGIAVSPATPADFLKSIADYVDYVLVMTVEPGFAGQKFIEGCLGKVEQVRRIIGPEKSLIVDGNISPEHALACKKAGADVFVLGTSGAYASRHIDADRLAGVRKALGESE